MCIPIIQNYSINPTVSKLSLAFNKSVTLKPAALCFVLHAEELAVPLQSYENYIENFFKRRNITKEYFLGRMNWTSELRYVVHKYLSVLDDIESVHGWNLDIIHRSIKDASQPSLFEGGKEDIYNAFVHLEEYLILLNISVDELRQKMGLEVGKDVANLKLCNELSSINLHADINL